MKNGACSSPSTKSEVVIGAEIGLRWTYISPCQHPITSSIRRRGVRRGGRLGVGGRSRAAFHDRAQKKEKLGSPKPSPISSEPSAFLYTHYRSRFRIPLSVQPRILHRDFITILTSL